jgi:D-beta-D-heptose 7-phosphate kinase/D-beta-D-heptose 1-phosphate adenosyltransferase
LGRAIEVISKESAREILGRSFSGSRILVVGDLILDQTYEGITERISPEAPIPVVEISSCRNGLGGAGNVAHNLARLECEVELAAVIGDDGEGVLVTELLDSKGIENGLVTSEKRMTTKKVRIVSARQQMLRLDFEYADDLSLEEEKTLMAKIATFFADPPEAVVLSDYGKGVCTVGVCQALIRKSRDIGIPLVVDPKGPDWDKYKGASLVTPNLKELGQALMRDVADSDEEIEGAARRLMKQYEIDSVLVTRSGKGFSLVQGGSVLHEPARALEVFDVTGAGDTVAAVLSAFVSAGASLEDSAKMANLAAGFVVGKVGTYAIDRDELLSILDGDGHLGLSEKERGIEEAAAIVEGWKRSGMRVAFTNGCFDILHAGHVHCLQKAKASGDRLVVGLNSDSSVKLNKGFGRPFYSQDLRAKVLSALDAVDLVVVFQEETPLSIITALKPDVLVKGGDYKESEIAGAREVRSRGGKVVIVPLVKGLSTTKILTHGGGCPGEGHKGTETL